MGITAAAGVAGVTLPAYLSAPAACIGVASAIETIMPGFWESAATGVGVDYEEKANAHAAAATVAFLAEASTRPSDNEVAAYFKTARDEWFRLHQPGLDYR